jgi:hypothetical protein
MPTLSSHPQPPVHNFSAHLLGLLGWRIILELSPGTSLHGEADRELPVLWWLVASPRCHAARGLRASPVGLPRLLREGAKPP